MLKAFYGSGTDDPLLARIILARTINSVCGGAVVAPWNVYELPDEWIDAFAAFSERLNKKQ